MNAHKIYNHHRIVLKTTRCDWSAYQIYSIHEIGMLKR